MSFRAISCLACQTVLRPRSRLVDFNKFYYNLKVTRGGHEFRHQSTDTRARGTKARVLDMLANIGPTCCQSYGHCQCLFLISTTCCIIFYKSCNYTAFTVAASGKLIVRPFNRTRRAVRASAGYQGQENFCYFGKLLTFVGVINFQLSPDNHLKKELRGLK